MPPEIRPATTADVEALLAFWAVAGENDGRPDDRPEAVVALLERDPEALLVATEGPDVVGTVIAGWDGWRAHLYRLAVHPGRRRQGVAAMLLDAAETRLVGLGATRLDAMVLDANDLGSAAWRARGYTAQPEWSRWVRPVVADPPEQRPALHDVRDGVELRRWYWLKAELVELARSRGVSPSGGKVELTDRLAAHLDGRPAGPTAIAIAGRIP